MKIYLNSKVSNEQECIEKKLRNCMAGLKKSPHSKKWNKRKDELKRYLDENPEMDINI